MAESTTSAAPLLALEDVSRRFLVRRGWFGEPQQLTAVAGVSLGLRRGESLGLVGESGCGKSTLGRLACGLLTPSEGRVLLEGRELPPASAASWAAGRIQMVFQDPFSSLNPRLSVRASVAEPLAARDMPRAERRRLADEMLATVGLEGMGGRYPHEFCRRPAPAHRRGPCPDHQAGRGHLRRAGFGPGRFGAGAGAQPAVRCAGAFQPVLSFISHDLAVVGFICPRILVMYLGQVVEEAPRERLFAGAAHPYSQALLAAMPTGDGESRLPRILEGELPSPLNPPAGCRFHPRCPKAVDICRREPPAWKELAPGWRARCHLL